MWRNFYPRHKLHDGLPYPHQIFYLASEPRPWCLAIQREHYAAKYSSMTYGWLIDSHSCSCWFGEKWKIFGKSFLTRKCRGHRHFGVLFHSWRMTVRGVSGFWCGDDAFINGAFGSWWFRNEARGEQHSTTLASGGMFPCQILDRFYAGWVFHGYLKYWCWTIDSHAKRKISSEASHRSKNGACLKHHKVRMPCRSIHSFLWWHQTSSHVHGLKLRILLLVTGGSAYSDIYLKLRNSELSNMSINYGTPRVDL